MFFWLPRIFGYFEHNDLCSIHCSIHFLLLHPIFELIKFSGYILYFGILNLSKYLSRPCLLADNNLMSTFCISVTLIHPKVLLHLVFLDLKFWFRTISQKFESSNIFSTTPYILMHVNFSGTLCTLLPLPHL